MLVVHFPRIVRCNRHANLASCSQLRLAGPLWNGERSGPMYCGMLFKLVLRLMLEAMPCDASTFYKDSRFFGKKNCIAPA